MKLIGALRAARVVLHLAWGMALALFYPGLSAGLRRRILRRWSIELLQILGVRVIVTGHDSMLQNGIVVANHISWLDMFVLNAISPLCFIAKSEVRGWPVIGWLSARVGTLYIRRGSARDALRVNGQLVRLLQDGASLAVFPEGTTTDGASVAHFHSSLLQPAIDAGAPIHPFAIRYHGRLGEHSRAPAYIDDLTLLESIWSVLCCNNLHVHIHATPPIATDGGDRRELARLARSRIGRAVELMHAAHLDASLASQRQSETNLQSMYGMLLFSPLPRHVAAAPID